MCVPGGLHVMLVMTTNSCMCKSAGKNVTLSEENPNL
jgi:hypothetical protein